MFFLLTLDNNAYRSGILVPKTIFKVPLPGIYRTTTHVLGVEIRLFFFGWEWRGGSILVGGGGGGGVKEFGGAWKLFCVQNLHSFPSNTLKKPKNVSACDGRTMEGGILRLVILITFFT